MALQSALPGLVDQKEIAAALRQCNYDPEEVISVYLAMFGETILQTSGDSSRSNLDSFRSPLLLNHLTACELKRPIATLLLLLCLP